MSRFHPRFLLSIFFTLEESMSAFRSITVAEEKARRHQLSLRCHVKWVQKVSDLFGRYVNLGFPERFLTIEHIFGDFILTKGFKPLFLVNKVYKHLFRTKD